MSTTTTKPKFKQTVFSFFNRPPSPTLDCKDASLTRQEFVGECDLNNIMAKYAAGLAPLPRGDRQPMFGDFSEIPDYQHALQIVIDAQERFAGLPSAVRERFANDPARLLDFLAKEENFEEGVKLGFFAPKKPAEKPLENKVDDVSVPVKGEGE